MIDQISSDRQRDGHCELGIEAGRWLLRLDDVDPDSLKPFATRRERDVAFLRWVGRSPTHLRVFFETYEVYRRLGCIDVDRAIEVRELVQQAREAASGLKGPRRQRSRAKMGSRLTRRARLPVPTEVFWNARPGRWRGKPRSMRPRGFRNTAWRSVAAAVAAVMVLSVSIFILTHTTPLSEFAQGNSVTKDDGRTSIREWYIEAHCGGPNGLIRRCDDEG